MFLATLPDDTQYRADLFELVNYQSDPVVAFERVCLLLQRVIKRMTPIEQGEILRELLLPVPNKAQDTPT